MSLERICELMRLPDFMNFHSCMEGLSSLFAMSHTMIGFNYTENGGVSSTKFYYVFDSVIPIDSFPMSTLKPYYRRLLPYLDRRGFLGKLTPGGGLTLTIKFDESGASSHGFFFRVIKSNSLILDSFLRNYPELSLNPDDFDSGYGQYITEKEGCVEKSEYIYLLNKKPVSSLGRDYGINFDGSDAVEISNASSGSRKKHKFIAVSIYDVVDGSFFDKGPQTTLRAMHKMGFRLICPAILPATRQYSIYAIGNWAGGRFSSSPIHDVFALLR